MTETTGPGERSRCALIVDFDNIFLGLKSIDPSAAERFATEPGRWLAWLEHSLPGQREGGKVERSVLIRRCYLNPITFHPYRLYFTRAAFSVIDCPPLTGQGKTSSDIHMVMDVLDILAEHPHIEEFIIFSGDADFTPVLLRLRSSDRRTTVLTVGPAAAAYTAACDLVISEDRFIEDGLGISSERPEERRTGAAPAVASTVPQEVLGRIAQRLYEEASADGEILPTTLPQVFKEFPEFTPDSNWLGFGSLRGLTGELVRHHPELGFAEGDPWKVVVRAPVRTPVRGSEERAEAAAGGGAGDGQEGEASAADELKQRIIEQVRSIVAEADSPVIMARAAHAVIHALGPQVTETRWAGEGTFKDLLLGAGAAGFTVHTAADSPGFVYDPDRHETPVEAGEAERFADLPPELVAFMRRINQVTGTPTLRPREYAVVFTALADDLRRHPFSPFITSKYVRDLCIESGKLISRANVLWILRGISFTGYRFGESPEEDTPRRMGELFRDNVLTLIENAPLELSTDEREMLDRWLLGGLEEAAARDQSPSR